MKGGGLSLPTALSQLTVRNRSQELRIFWAKSAQISGTGLGGPVQPKTAKINQKSASTPRKGGPTDECLPVHWLRLRWVSNYTKLVPPVISAELRLYTTALNCMSGVCRTFLITAFVISWPEIRILKHNIGSMMSPLLGKCVAQFNSVY